MVRLSLRQWLVTACAVTAMAVWLGIVVPYATLQSLGLLANFQSAAQLQLALNILGIGVYFIAGAVALAILPPEALPRANRWLIALALLNVALHALSYVVVGKLAQTTTPLMMAAIPFIGIWSGGRLAILLRDVLGQFRRSATNENRQQG